MPNDLPAPAPVPQQLVPTSAALQASPGYPAPALYGEPAGGGGPDWRRIFAAVRRFKWLVLGVVVLGTGAGFGVSRLIKPGYVARATIWVTVEDTRGRGIQSVSVSSQLPITSGWPDLLYSDAVMQYVVRQHRLYLSWDPADSSAFERFDLQQRLASGGTGNFTLQVDSTGTRYTLTRDDGTRVEQGAVGDSVGRALGWLWAPPTGMLAPRRAIVFTVAPPLETSQTLAASITSKSDENGNFMRLELRAPDPAYAANVLNAIAERFVQLAADLKKQKSVELTAILSGQLQRARADLASAEAALRAFRVRSATQLALSNDGRIDTRDPSVNTYFNDKVTLEQLQEDQRVVRRVLASADSGVSSEQLENVPSVQHSANLTALLRELDSKQAELRALLQRYTDEQPSVVRMKRDIDELSRTSIPQALQGLDGELTVRINDLQQHLSSSSSTLQAIPGIAIDDERLARDVATKAQTLGTVQQLYDQAKLQEASTLRDVRILDPAVEPKRPVGSIAPVLIALAFLGSLGAGVIGAVLLDRTDTRFRYPEQVTTDMGLSILGVVPRVSRENGNGRNAPQVIEALRSIRLGVQNAYGTGPMVVTITSPGSSDGKSFITSNLGLAFADAGLRTIVIDGDIRRGLLHRVLNAKRKPGLIDHLAGNAGREDIIQKTDFPQLSFIGCGQRTPNGPELLSSPAMGQLITSLRSRYDVILVDSAPMAAGVDPYVLGTLTGNLLLVMRTGVTDREMAQAKVDLLDRLPVRVLGAVLNDVEAGGAYRYYAYYLAGYEVSEEETERKLVRPG
jgi:succinoglycan biosynthesis transport protein ExoP